MTKRTRTSKTDDIVADLALTTTTTTTTTGQEQPAPKRYRLRSGAVGTTIDDKENVTKSSTEKQKPKPRSAPRPFIEYKGEVEYYTRAEDIEAASAKLLQWVKSEATREEVTAIPIAFDMEWPFSFQTGSGRSAVIQLCADVNRCYVLHISQLKVLPPSLLQLLYHEKVCLHGVCVKNDLRKLQRDFPVVDSQRLIDQCVDLGVWCNEVCNTRGRWSMADLVIYLCNLQINKDSKVRRSKWHIQPLTSDQQIYAAIDVYIAQVMYLDLEQRHRQKIADEAQIVAEHGAKALAAIKQLQ